MQSRKIEIPPISESDLALPIVQKLLAIVQAQAEQICHLREEVQTLKAEVARLKNHKSKPEIKTSNLDKKNPDDDKKSGGGRRPGSDKESKKDIPIHEIIRIKPALLRKSSVYPAFYSLLALPE